MSETSLQIAVGDYDRTRPLIDGLVHVEGCDSEVITGDLEEIFLASIRTRNLRSH